jgi:hypothetical protein
MARSKEQDLSWAGFFVSHTLADAEYCRQLILPAIEAVVHRGFNQYVFMDYENFGRRHKSDGSNAHLFAAAYAREIERLLDNSQAMLLVASLAATRSKWVKYEVDWWVQNRPLEELTVIVREPCDPSVLNSAVTQCPQHEMYDPKNVVHAERLCAIIDSLIPR